jgi:hypothetical protein
MSDGSMNQDLLAMWKRTMDQSMEAWQRLIAQPPTTEISQFWRPLFGQGFDVWAQLLKEGVASPDVLAQWKRFLDDSVEAWSRALGKAMETEAFAAAMGKFLEQYLNTIGPMRKTLQASNEELLRTMNLPSRKQVTDLASTIISLEVRLEALEDRIEELVERLSHVAGVVTRAAESQDETVPMRS